MQRRIITTVLTLAALAPAASAHASGGAQDPLLSGYGSPGTGEQVVLPPPAAGTGKSAAASSDSLDPAVTETPAALAAPRTESAGGSSGRKAAQSASTVRLRPVAERRAIIAAASAGKAEAPLFDTSDLTILAIAMAALAGFALAARPHRRHG